MRLRREVKLLNSSKLSVVGLRLDRAMSRAVARVRRSCEDSSSTGVRYHQHLDKFSDGLKKSALLKKSDISNKNLIV